MPYRRDSDAPANSIADTLPSGPPIAVSKDRRHYNTGYRTPPEIRKKASSFQDPFLCVRNGDTDQSIKFPGMSRSCFRSRDLHGLEMVFRRGRYWQSHEKAKAIFLRSEERRVGKEGSTGR